MQYTVSLFGGSIEEVNNRNNQENVVFYDDIEEARKSCKAKNKSLTKGEKEHFGLKYKVEKCATIKKIRRGKESFTTGTLDMLTKYFSYTLLCGNEYNNKISQNPRSFESLVNNLNRAIDETQGSCYDRDSYWLVEKTEEVTA